MSITTADRLASAIAEADALTQQDSKIRYVIREVDGEGRGTFYPILNEDEWYEAQEDRDIPDTALEHETHRWPDGTTAVCRECYKPVAFDGEGNGPGNMEQSSEGISGTCPHCSLWFAPSTAQPEASPGPGPESVLVGHLFMVDDPNSGRVWVSDKADDQTTRHAVASINVGLLGPTNAMRFGSMLAMLPTLFDVLNTLHHKTVEAKEFDFNEPGPNDDFDRVLEKSARTLEEYKVLANHHSVTGAIAVLFSAKLLAYMGSIKFLQMVELQRNKPQKNICYSGDYCDSNVFMAEAFDSVLGYENDVASSADAMIWNTAWDTAKRHLFYCTPSESAKKKLRDQVAGKDPVLGNLENMTLCVKQLRDSVTDRDYPGLPDAIEMAETAIKNAGGTVPIV